MPKLEWYIGDLTTGRHLISLPVLGSSSWSRTLNQSDSIHAVVPTFDPDVKALELFGSAVSGKNFLAVAYGGYVLAAGPIWTVTWNDTDRTLTLDAEGLASYFAHRLLMPLSALTSPTVAVSTWSNISLGSIAVHIVQQSETFPGGNLPIVYPADIVDTGTTRTYNAADTLTILDKLDELSQVQNGPDIDFLPRWVDDTQRGIEWVMRVGTPSQPMLSSATVFQFNASIAGSTIKDIEMVFSGTQLAGQGWATTTNATDGKTLVARSTDNTLISAGFPLLEMVDSRHDITIHNTLQGYANAITVNGKFPIQSMRFSAKADEGPTLGNYNVGDWLSVAYKGNDFLPDGNYLSRIVSIAGDADGRYVAITAQGGR